jgi:hypothetical protein
MDLQQGSPEYGNWRHHTRYEIETAPNGCVGLVAKASTNGGTTGPSITSCRETPSILEPSKWTPILPSISKTQALRHAHASKRLDQREIGRYFDWDKYRLRSLAGCVTIGTWSEGTPPMLLKALTASTCLWLGSLSAVHAVPVEYNGKTYDVTEVYGSYDELSDLLIGQPWMNGKFYTEPDYFAMEYGKQLEWGYSPYFFRYLGTDCDCSDYNQFYTFGAYSYRDQPHETPTVYRFELWYYSPTYYAIATEIVEDVPAVPLPAGGLLLLTGIAGAAALKRRAKRDA